jgi:beta-N-acetylhexosaminidase
MRGASGERGIPAAAVLSLVAGADLLCIGTENTDNELAAIEAAIASAVTDGTLAADRITAAARRNRELAGRLGQFAAERPVPMGGEPAFPLRRAIDAFDLQPGVSVGSRRLIVTVETTANIAVGVSPWGLGAAGVGIHQLRRGDALPGAVSDDEQLVIVGKDNHRHPWVRELVDLARERHPSTLVIDMGWPAPDRRYADVATFGASRYVGQALAAWLEGAGR